MNKPELPRTHAGAPTSRAAESTRLLAAALIPLGMLASTGAEAGVSDPPPSAPFLSRVDATVEESVPGEFTYTFTVFNESRSGPLDSAGNPTLGGYQIVDWELPFFSLEDLNLHSISQPDGWGHEILERQDDGTYEVISADGDPLGPSNYFDTDGPYGNYGWDYDAALDPLLVGDPDADPEIVGDPDLYGPNPHVFNEAPYIIHWVTPCREATVDPETFDLAGTNAAGGLLTAECLLDEGNQVEALDPIREGGELTSLTGFTFTSGFSSQNAPYLASWFLEPPTSGDPPIPAQPFGTPLSPARLAAQDVPAPATALLLGAGLVAFSLYRRRALIA